MEGIDAMTRKDYVKFAEMLSRLDPGTAKIDAANQHDKLTIAIAAIFANDNPRFDENRFYKACEPKGE